MFSSSNIPFRDLKTGNSENKQGSVSLVAYVFDTHQRDYCVNLIILPVFLYVIGKQSFMIKEKGR